MAIDSASTGILPDDEFEQLACRACGDPVEPCGRGPSWLSAAQDLCYDCATGPEPEPPAECAHCGDEIEVEAEDVCDDCGGLIHDRCLHTGALSCAAWHRVEELGEAI